MELILTFGAIFGVVAYVILLLERTSFGKEYVHLGGFLFVIVWIGTLLSFVNVNPVIKRETIITNSIKELDITFSKPLECEVKRTIEPYSVEADTFSYDCEVKRTIEPYSVEADTFSYDCEVKDKDLEREIQKKKDRYRRIAETIRIELNKLSE